MQLILIIHLVFLAGCGGGGSGGAESSSHTEAINKIASYAKSGGPVPDIQDYLDAGVSGVTANNIDAINQKIRTLTYQDVDTEAEIQTIADELNVTLKDTTPPVITLKGENPLNLKKGDSYNEAGATATDNIDGSLVVTITGQVDTTKVGIYTINYQAVDQSKNKTVITRTVIVKETACSQVITHAYNPDTGEEKDFATPCDVPAGWVVGVPPVAADTTSPVIHLIGSATVNLLVGATYNDAGATALDNVDGDVSGNIIVSNPVNTSLTGTYIVTYNVNDAAGNHAIQVTRTVIVSQPIKTFGQVGVHSVAAPVAEPVNGNSVIIMPTGVTAQNPVPVVFFAPGWRSVDYHDYESLLNFIASQGYAVIVAKDDSGAYSADHLINYFKEMVASPAITPLLDTSRMGVIGHSSGGGHAFAILDNLSDTMNWGTQGRFLFVMEPWFAFDLDQTDLKTLPNNTNAVIVQFGVGGNNAANDTDARIPLSEFYLLASIPDEQKDYQIFVDADHNYPKGNNPYSQMQGILKPLDALMELTFKEAASVAPGAHQAALEVGNDNPYADGLGMQTVKSIKDYHYRCHGVDNSGASTTLVNSGIDYCAIYPGAFPPETDFSAIPTNNTVAKPASGQSFVDREFGKRVIRLTDRLNQNDTPTVNANGDRYSRGNAHPYPKTQAWNNDMSMFRLHYRLYDAVTLEELPITSGTNSLHELYNINGALSEMKWSNINPNVFYGVYGSQFWKGTINRVSNTISYDLVHDFSSPDYTFDQFTLGKYEGNIDFNDKYVAFAARKTGTQALTAIVYDMQNDSIKAMQDFPAISWPDAGQVFDWLSVSPLGNHILMSTNDKIEQYDMNLNHIRQLATSGGHGDLGIDQGGGEVYVQYEFGANFGIWIYRLSDGFRIQLLPDKYNGGHISCRNYKRRGWCYASTTAEGHREIVAIKLDYTGPVNHIVNRFAQTHTSGHNSLGNVSPDGRQVMFYSDWGDGALHWADRDTYLVK